MSPEASLKTAVGSFQHSSIKRLSRNPGPSGGRKKIRRKERKGIKQKKKGEGKEREEMG